MDYGIAILQFKALVRRPELFLFVFAAVFTLFTSSVSAFILFARAITLFIGFASAFHISIFAGAVALLVGFAVTFLFVFARALIWARAFLFGSGGLSSGGT